jgi:hypothetical protein
MAVASVRCPFHGGVIYGLRASGPQNAINWATATVRPSFPRTRPSLRACNQHAGRRVVVFSRSCISAAQCGIVPGGAELRSRPSVLLGWCRSTDPVHRMHAQHGAEPVTKPPMIDVNRQSTARRRPANPAGAALVALGGRLLKASPERWGRRLALQRGRARGGAQPVFSSPCSPSQAGRRPCSTRLEAFARLHYSNPAFLVSDFPTPLRASLLHDAPSLHRAPPLRPRPVTAPRAPQQTPRPNPPAKCLRHGHACRDRLGAEHQWRKPSPGPSRDC